MNSNIQTAIASIQQLGKELATQRKDKPKIKPGFLTVAQFLTLQGLNSSHGERILLGLELNKLARIRGVKLPDQRPGFPCAYPVALLSSVTNSGKA